MGFIARSLLIMSLATLGLMMYVRFRFVASVALLRPGLLKRARIVTWILFGWVFGLPITALILWRLGNIKTLFVNSPSVSWADYLFHFPSWVALIAVAELAPLFLVIDLTALCARLLPAVHDKVRRLLAVARVALAFLMVMYVTVRVATDTAHVRDSVVPIHIRGIPAEFDSLRIVLVADIQVDRYTGESKVSQVRQIIQSHNPDLLLAAGDMVTSGTAYLAEAAASVRGLHGSIATAAVMGDHDYWSAPDSVKAFFERDGWAFLNDQHRVYSYRGRTILVTGLTHVYSDRLNEAEIGRFLDSAPHTDFRILLVHQPAEMVINAAAAHGYNLVLAGHTHGGQIVIHPLGIPWAPSKMETRYYRGVYEVGSTTVVVTRGVGQSIAPIRYSSPAEVTTLLVQVPGR